MKILRGILITVGFLIVFGAVGQDDSETFRILEGIDIIPTPFAETVTKIVAGLILILGGIFSGGGEKNAKM